MPKKRRNWRRDYKPWTPFQRGYLPPVAMAMANTEEVWINNRYQVNVTFIPDAEGKTELTQLAIKRIDKQPIHDWRDLQRIKNELCGAEREAVELYPAESRRVDTANQYHLWVLSEGQRIPFGYEKRIVSEDESMGNRQRPFPPDARPEDLLEGEALLTADGMSSDDVRALLEERDKERRREARARERQGGKR